MTSNERISAIRRAIAKQTVANTATRATARKVLIAEGIYSNDGKLTVNYGGQTRPRGANKVKK